MTAPDYVSVDEVKATMELTGLSFADDDIELAVSAASRAIDEQCGRRFYPDDDADQVRKFLPQNPGYCIIDDLAEFTALVSQESTWELDHDFYLEPTNAAADGRPFTAIRTIARPFIFTLAEISQGWAGFDGRIAVTGMWGWAATPPEITQAAKLLAIRLMRRSREAPFGVLSYGSEMAAGAVRLARMDPDVAALIEPYTLSILF
jgi:hypothetical protein